ncbi:MAG: Winged helix-turn-helix transcription repressor DNA-binding [Lasallia pustulata]|uniref:Winged helix-turn-helix transcription repressor DNA-binding n=1 Tax=Lasallia pustulata TaxID=136370 RepID=A0A5M8PNV5_9LECA|nr:MAG: Winged helix-turn-helix transcription repressor DNA-binding [Lasallia pustulata]
MTTHRNAQALSLLEDSATTGRSYVQDETGTREKLLSLTKSLSAAVELPSEAIQRMGWAEPARSAEVKIAGNLKLFDKLAEKEDVGLTAAELATESKADPILTSCIMRHLVAMNVVGEKGADHYVATPFSTALTEPKYRDGITYAYIPYLISL